MNLMGRADAPAAPPAGPSALAGLAGQSHLLNWADKTFGQGLTSLTKGAWLKAPTYARQSEQLHHCIELFWNAQQQVPLQTNHEKYVSHSLLCRPSHGGECCTCSSETEKSIMYSSCSGVKVLLAGEQQAAVTVAVEGLMDGKPLPELESFLTLDPKVPSSLLPSLLAWWLKSKSLLLCCYCTPYIGLYTAVKLSHVRRSTWRDLCGAARQACMLEMLL